MEKKKPVIFDFWKSINTTKKDILKDGANIKDYNPFMINQWLSYYSDTLYYAEEMNKCHGLKPHMQYYFYLYSLPKVRFRKIISEKKNKDEDIRIIRRYYNYSYPKALQILKVIPPDWLIKIRETINRI